MPASAWRRLTAAISPAAAGDWLATTLARNAGTAYLRAHGSPRDLDSFRSLVPVVGYGDLTSYLDQMSGGEPDVLFPGRPVAFERTGGSSGAAKLIPYSAEGLADFRRALLPWLVNGARHFGVTGRVYLSISPVTRAPESIGGVPVGLPDGAYLGESAGPILAELSVVPFEVAQLQDVERWRKETLDALRNANDLELISCWSPTFLLRLLDELPSPQSIWPRLKVVSCWASASSRPFADELAARVPHAVLQPKGLMSTECVVTVPDEEGRPILSPHGFFEFEPAAAEPGDGRLWLAQDLEPGKCYGVIATTASGLYRYRTGDLVRFEGTASNGQPVLEFIGRGELVSDLIGEKLTEPFVAGCLLDVRGFRMLVPEPGGDGYVLVMEAGVRASVHDVEERLCANPQYAYARRIGQLKEVRVLELDRFFDCYVQWQLRRGVRLGDVKPIALRRERSFLPELGVSL